MIHGPIRAHTGPYGPRRARMGGQMRKQREKGMKHIMGDSDFSKFMSRGYGKEAGPITEELAAGCLRPN